MFKGLSVILPGSSRANARHSRLARKRDTPPAALGEKRRNRRRAQTARGRRRGAKSVSSRPGRVRFARWPNVTRRRPERERRRQAGGDRRLRRARDLGRAFGGSQSDGENAGASRKLRAIRGQRTCPRQHRASGAHRAAAGATDAHRSRFHVARYRAQGRAQDWPAAIRGQRTRTSANAGTGASVCARVRRARKRTGIVRRVCINTLSRHSTTAAGDKFQDGARILRLPAFAEAIGRLEPSRPPVSRNERSRRWGGF